MHEAHGLTAHAADAKDSAADAVREAPAHAVQRTQGAPMVGGAIAMGVGFLVASVLPPSRRETTATVGLLEKLEPVKEELEATAQGMAAHLKEPVTEAAAAIPAIAALWVASAPVIAAACVAYASSTA